MVLAAYARRVRRWRSNKCVVHHLAAECCVEWAPDEWRCSGSVLEYGQTSLSGTKDDAVVEVGNVVEHYSPGSVFRSVAGLSVVY